MGPDRVYFLSFRGRNPGIVTIRRTFGMRCANTRTIQEKEILESLPSRGRLECDVPTLALHGSKESWNRSHPEDDYTAMCQHSHCRGYMGILPEITTSWKRNPPEERGFRLESPAHRRGIRPRKKIPAGITSLFSRVEVFKIKMRGKSFEWYVTPLGLGALNPVY
jgi:hypothetical protein